MPDDNSLVALDNPAVRVTEMGLTFTGSVTYTEWVDVGKRLSKVYRTLHWLLGDWLNYGEQHYGEMYTQAMADTGFDYSTLATDKWVASRFIPERRHNALSFSHHKVLAALPPAEQDTWLDAAEIRGLTRQELREVVRSTQETDRVLPGQEPGPHAPDPGECPMADTCPHVREWRECYEKVLEATRE